MVRLKLSESGGGLPIAGIFCARDSAATFERIQAVLKPRPIMKNTASKVAHLHYPESDGKPMAETDLHRNIMLALLHALEQFFKEDPQVYIAGNILLYYEKGNPKASCAPDVFVVRGIPKGLRRVYKVWEEGKAPDTVIELTSRSTRQEDMGRKKTLYAELKIQEYFLFDPYHEYLTPSLRGYSLQEGNYIPMEPSGGRLRSQVTGLELGVVDQWLRLFNPVTGKILLTPAEAEEAWVRVEQALKASEEARKAAEAENRRLAEQLERLRAELKNRSR